jgi:NADH:ubiquinone oxidoreductase subunit 4 (subunit M)
MTPPGWSAVRNVLALHPFCADKMAFSLFFASLIGLWRGMPVLSVFASCILGAAIGLPSIVAFARRIKDLMDDADGGV